jgi:ADP-heptose:LPS heptosyltransferase
MKSNNLILIDKFFGIVFQPVIILNCFIGYFFKKEPKVIKKVLIIKFLGAGNIIALENFYKNFDITYLTSDKNKSVISILNKKNVIIYTNYKIFSSTFKLIYFCFFYRFDCVINLESESHFAYFLTSIARSRFKTGITNKHKSYRDNLLYSKHIVKSQDAQYNQIIDYFLLNKYEGGKQENNINLHKLLKIQNKIIHIFPTCSDVDINRRLPIHQWDKIMLSLYKNNIVEIIVQDNDYQYNSFKKLAKKYNIEIKNTNYNDFWGLIKKSEVIVTVDSQALHISQYFNKLVFCFFGPTNETNIWCNKKTIPIKNNYFCSPCTHKYFVAPCKNKQPCMNFFQKK